MPLSGRCGASLRGRPPCVQHTRSQTLPHVAPFAKTFSNSSLHCNAHQPLTPLALLAQQRAHAQQCGHMRCLRACHHKPERQPHLARINVGHDTDVTVLAQVHLTARLSPCAIQPQGGLARHSIACRRLATQRLRHRCRRACNHTHHPCQQRTRGWGGTQGRAPGRGLPAAWRPARHKIQGIRPPFAPLALTLRLNRALIANMQSSPCWRPWRGRPRGRKRGQPRGLRHSQPGVRPPASPELPQRHGCAHRRR